MPHNQETMIGYDVLKYCINDWMKDLWLENNKERIKDDQTKEQVESELRQKLGDIFNNNRGLTQAQSFSDLSFRLFTYGTTLTVGSISEGAADAILDTRPVAAWRKNVSRNTTQAAYSLFETILKETLEKRGEEVAIAILSRQSFSEATKVANTLEYYDLQSTLGLKTVTDLIRKIQQARPEVDRASMSPR